MAEGSAQLPAPGPVGLAVLAEALAGEVHEREDDEDWELEDWPKEHVVEQLRQLPPVGRCSLEGGVARISTGEDCDTDTASELPLSPGVAARMSPGGKICGLEFSLDCPPAVKRLALLLEQPRPEADAS
uniref:Uncharacterized protein n=1 Tax=Alexandrium monilatum TaxID=311494 RepID=A0A7S4RVC8_9DINO